MKFVFLAFLLFGQTAFLALGIWHITDGEFARGLLDCALATFYNVLFILNVRSER